MITNNNQNNKNMIKRMIFTITMIINNNQNKILIIIKIIFNKNNIKIKIKNNKIKN